MAWKNRHDCIVLWTSCHSISSCACVMKTSLSRAQRTTVDVAARAEELFKAAKLRQVVPEPASESETNGGQALREFGWSGSGAPMQVDRRNVSVD